MKTIKTLALFCATAIALTSCSSDNDDNDIDVDIDLTAATLFTTNNSDANVRAYQFVDGAYTTQATFTTPTAMADGIYFDSNTNTIVQASRTSNGLQGYSGISANSGSATVSVDVTGTLDMVSPREVAVSGNIYVVADNSDADGNDATPDGRLFIYTKNSGSNTFVLRNTLTTDFKVWGITFGGPNGNRLFAVVDTTGDLAMFDNFIATNNSDATILANKTITIGGIVRTHGLTYDGASDTMVLTDIAAAMNGGNDGAFHVISDFSTKFNSTADGGTLATSQQTRIAGTNTMLGNPVDVAFDGRTETVYIAEAANGKILAFNNFSAGGNIAPTYSADVASASAVYLHKQ